ncbi:MAG: Fic family protein [Bacillota bacterium]
MFDKFDKNQIEQMKNKALMLSKRLSTMRLLSQAEAERLYEDFSIEFAYDSNAIEGNAMTLMETCVLIKEGVTVIDVPMNDQVEIWNHHKFFMNLVTNQVNKKYLSKSLILDVHKSLLLSTKPEIAGKYRKINVGVGANVNTMYQAPEWSDVESHMKQYIEKFNEKNKQDILSFVDAHIDFERIHPFADGNGRTGRMLLNLQLIKAGYLPINIKFADRRDYIQAFKNITRANDRTFMYGIVLNLEIEALKKRIEMLK